MQAIMIKFTTPSASTGARVKLACGSHKAVYGYDHSTDTVGNARACVKQFLSDLNWDYEYEVGSLGDGSYCAVMIPERYIKAADAVVGVRRAISRGDLNGNPHSKQWVQSITDLTDGGQKDGFAVQYAAAVAQGL